MILVIDNHSKGKKKKKGIITNDDIMQCEWRNTKLNLFVPKFEFEYKIQLKDAIQEMGTNCAFDEPSGSADFSGMNEKSDLYIAAVIHKTMIKVNET